jgi:hypothetical protein
MVGRLISVGPKSRHLVSLSVVAHERSLHTAVAIDPRADSFILRSGFAVDIQVARTLPGALRTSRAAAGVVPNHGVSLASEKG